MKKWAHYAAGFMAVAALMAALSAQAGTTTYKYDAQGRVIEIDYPNGKIARYTYDSAGNRKQVTTS